MRYFIAFLLVLLVPVPGFAQKPASAKMLKKLDPEVYAAAQHAEQVAKRVSKVWKDNKVEKNLRESALALNGLLGKDVDEIAFLRALEHFTGLHNRAMALEIEVEAANIQVGLAYLSHMSDAPTANDLVKNHKDYLRWRSRSEEHEHTFAVNNAVEGIGKAARAKYELMRAVELGPKMKVEVDQPVHLLFLFINYTTPRA